jgi:hypothetical protein
MVEMWHLGVFQAKEATALVPLDGKSAEEQVNNLPDYVLDGCISSIAAFIDAKPSVLIESQALGVGGHGLTVSG